MPDTVLGTSDTVMQKKEVCNQAREADISKSFTSNYQITVVA